MNSLEKFAVAACVVVPLLQGCGSPLQNGDSKLRIAFDLSAPYLNQAVGTNSSELEPSPAAWISATGILAQVTALQAPANWSSFDCIAVNVVGEGIGTSTYLAGMQAGGYCSYLGITSKALKLGSGLTDIELTVPIGANRSASRLVQVLGVLDPKNLYCSKSETLGSSYPMTSANNGSALLFELGRAVVTPSGDTQVVVEDTYSTLSAASRANRWADCENTLNTLIGSFVYSSSTIVYALNAPISTMTPSFSNSPDPIVGFSLPSPLPSGLILDTVSGAIAGTPTEISSPTPYTIVATNLYGSATTTVTIGVVAPSPSPSPAPSAVSGLQNFDYSGADQAFIVPSVSAITVKAWGAAGGSRDSGNTGGAGGFAQATIPVTPGQSMIVVVGQGGAAAYTSSGMSYGFGGFPDQHGAGGGGLSGVFLSNVTQSNALVIAGGGGGGRDGQGGPGGGLTGVNGIGGGGGPGALGGTQMAAGNGGAALYGANGDCRSDGNGGGGGGYFGGGYDFSSGTCSGGGGSGAGGGGSGFAIPSASNVHLESVTLGSTAPPNASDTNYVSPVGVPTLATGPGGNGRVTISW